MVLPIVGHIEIVGFRWELRRQRIDLKHRGSDSQRFTQRAYLQPALSYQLPNALIRDSHLFQRPQACCRELSIALQRLLNVNNMLNSL